MGKILNGMITIKGHLKCDCAGLAEWQGLVLVCLIWVFRFRRAEKGQIAISWIWVSVIVYGHHMSLLLNPYFVVFNKEDFDG